MKIRGSVVNSSFKFPRPPEEKNQYKKSSSPSWFAVPGVPRPLRLRYQNRPSAPLRLNQQPIALAWRSPKSWKPTRPWFSSPLAAASCFPRAAAETFFDGTAHLLVSSCILPRWHEGLTKCDGVLSRAYQARFWQMSSNCERCMFFETAFRERLHYFAKSGRQILSSFFFYRRDCCENRSTEQSIVPNFGTCKHTGFCSNKRDLKS